MVRDKLSQMRANQADAAACLTGGETSAVLDSNATDF